MISRTDPDRELYEARLRERRDKASLQQTARAEGHGEGRAETRRADIEALQKSFGAAGDAAGRAANALLERAGKHLGGPAKQAEISRHSSLEPAASALAHHYARVGTAVVRSFLALAAARKANGFPFI